MRTKPSPLPIDETYRQYATETQWRAYVTYCEAGGSKKGAARVLNCSRATLQDHLRALTKKAAQQGYGPPDITHQVPDGLTLKGTSIRYDGDGRIQQYWNKTKVQGREVEETTQLKDPKKIVKVSKLFDQQGNVIQEWVSERPEDIGREKAWEHFAESLSKKIVPAPLIKRPRCTLGDQLPVYGVGDHHMGMYAWPEETGGAPYDVKLSKKLLHDAVAYLVDSTPATTEALLVVLGDFTHTDGYAPLTPASGHLLDADTRFPNVAEAAADALNNAVQLVLKKHQRVRVIVTAGNHDPVSAVWLRISLRARFRLNRRVTVDMSPSKFHYFEWGNNLLGATHGDRIKLENLPALMANDQPEAWGRTRHRAWFTGHRHHDEVKDLLGAKVIIVRVLAPNDAYSAKSGYRTPRDMKATIFHRQYGESGSVVAPAEMFSQGLV